MPENTNSGGQQKPTLSWSQPVGAKPVAAASANGGSKPATPAAPVTNNKNVSASAAQSSSMGAYVGIFVAGLIIGALVGWGITTGKGGGNTAITASSTNETVGATNNTATSSSNGAAVDLSGSSVGSSGNVTVVSPQTAGFAVAVSKASVSQPTWLVVYEDHAGVPGNAIGAGLFFAGQTSGTIELLRATLPGQSYFVGQSLDDGDRVFSLTADKPVRDAQGNPLFTEFKAQ